MKLSIIIVSYNTKELLKRCLESVISSLCLVTRDKKSNTLPIPNHPARHASQGEAGRQSPTTEIIVVDNGSTDGSVEMVRGSVISGLCLVTRDRKSNTLPITNHPARHASQGEAGRQSPITLCLIENKENLGFAKAVNQALRRVYTERSRSAQGKVFLLLNSDTIVKPGALEKLLEFEEKVRPAIIGARLLNPDGTTQPSVFHLPTIKRAIKEYWLGKKGCFSKYAPFGTEPVLVEAVIGGAMLISREIIEKIGLFDERYFMFFEDLDYCRRAGKAGYKIFYLPAAEIIHEHGASGKNLAVSENQWKRLIPSSKIYHGRLNYYWLSFILRLGQKWQRLLRRGE